MNSERTWWDQQDHCGVGREGDEQRTWWDQQDQCGVGREGDEQ